MARTRAQEVGHSHKEAPSTTQDGNKATRGAISKPQKGKAKSIPKKRQHDEEDSAMAESTPSKKAKSAPSAKRKRTSAPSSKVSALLSKYGAIPLQHSLPDATSATPSTLLALIINAMLSSARISHSLAAKTVDCLIQAGYHDIHTLKSSSWQERTEVLTEGGYTRYREKTATMLGELADLVLGKYDGDLNNVLKQADSSPSHVRTALKEIKGIGDVGANIFLDTVQGVWPSLAPFIDPRSLRTAQQIGLGGVEELWQDVGQDAMEMCKLSMALNTVRLEKKEKEFS